MLFMMFGTAVCRHSLVFRCRQLCTLASFLLGQCVLSVRYGWDYAESIFETSPFPHTAPSQHLRTYRSSFYVHFIYGPHPHLTLFLRIVRLTAVRPRPTAYPTIFTSVVTSVSLTCKSRPQNLHTSAVLNPPETRLPPSLPSSSTPILPTDPPTTTTQRATVALGL